MEYLLKASAVIVIFYTCYKICLQRDTFFEQNRWFLLAGLVVAAFLPFIVIPIYIEAQPINFDNLVFVEDNIATAPTRNSFDILFLLNFIYVLGVIIFSLRFISQITSLLPLIVNSEKQRIDGYNFVKTHQNISPFSFFNYIVYNPKSFSETELEQIITHEKVHVGQHHTFDILLAHLACIVFWFNPFIWFYNKALKQNLEFIADKTAINFSTCKKSYQYTLLKTSMPTHQLALTNNFYNSLIKKRIVMLHKSKSKKINLLKFALIIPALALFLMSFNTKEVIIEKEKFKNEFIISSQSTKSDLKTIEDYFKKKKTKLKFEDLIWNSNNELQRVTIKTKFPKDLTFTKRLSLNNNLKEKNINPFMIRFNSKDNTINFSQLQNENSSSKLSINNMVLSGKNSISYLNNNEEKNINNTVIEIIITKDFTDSDFEKLKTTFKNEGITLKIKGVKRNKQGDITAIKIEVSSKSSNANYSIDTDEAISPIKISVEDDGKNISIGNGQLKKEHQMVFITKDGEIHETNDSGSGNNVFVFSSDDDNSEDIEVKTIIMKDGDTSKIMKKHKVKMIRFNSDKDSTFFVTKKDNEKKAYHVTVKTDGDKDDITWVTEDTNDRKVIAASGSDNNIKIISKDGNKPLFMVDGKEITQEDMNNIKPDTIESVNVLKGDSATKKYGEKAKDGVIEIILKK